jgi:hypothetical protein
VIGDPKGDPLWPGRTPTEKTMILDESSWDGDGTPQFPGGQLWNGYDVGFMDADGWFYLLDRV